jgi:hypothetical protein
MHNTVARQSSNYQPALEQTFEAFDTPAHAMMCLDVTESSLGARWRVMLQTRHLEPVATGDDNARRAAATVSSSGSASCARNSLYDRLCGIACLAMRAATPLHS